MALEDALPFPSLTRARRGCVQLLRKSPNHHWRTAVVQVFLELGVPRVVDATAVVVPRGIFTTGFDVRGPLDPTNVTADLLRTRARIPMQHSNAARALAHAIATINQASKN